MRVNIGCGKTPTLGWENFDNSLSLKISWFPNISLLLYKLKLINRQQLDLVLFCNKTNIRWADATKKLPLPSDSVEILYSSHMLEHLDREDAELFLREAQRILKPGGIIRLVVPDIEKIIDSYNKHKDADSFIESTQMCASRPRNLSQRLRMALVGARHHQWMYDGKSLAKLLKKHNFSRITVLPPGETAILDPGPLNLLEREEGSLFIEAVKV